MVSAGRDSPDCGTRIGEAPLELPNLRKSGRPWHDTGSSVVGGRTIDATSTPISARFERLASRSRVGIPASLSIGGFVVVVGVLVAFRLLDVYPWNAAVFDLRTYWATRSGLDFSGLHAGPAGAYLYSPAFAQLISPLTALPLPVFSAIWTALGAALLYWLTGRRALALLLLPIVLITVVQGQLDLAFAAVVVVGLRWPAVWALPLLTKVTPGVGLVWFLVRREWRSLGIALATTVAIVAISARIDPQAWAGWFALLGRSEFPSTSDGLLFVPIALWARLPVAVAIVAWGAATNRPWTIPIAVTLGMPIVWLNSPTILVAILPLVAAGADTPAGRWLRAGLARDRAATEGVGTRVGTRVSSPSA
jgi:hypothetical protein